MTTIAIIGAGVIGTGWAARCLAHGHEVSLWDPNAAAFDTATRSIEQAWKHMQAMGLTADRERRNPTFHEHMEDACDGATWVQEAAPENEALKRDLIASLDRLLGPETIIASSSSGLLPSRLQANCAHPERVLVGHPFNPVYLLPLVEVVPGARTSRARIDEAKTFYASLGMHPLEVRTEIEGYLSDRLQEAVWREILHLVNDGVADTAELDDAIRYGPGLRWAILGTCLNYHLAGGEGGMAHMLEQFGPTLDLPWARFAAPPLTDELSQRMVTGTASQTKGRTVRELEELRDECLVSVMQALARYERALRAS
jgi:carnitine 3-dehydrogenase